MNPRHQGRQINKSENNMEENSQRIMGNSTMVVILIVLCEKNIPILLIFQLVACHNNAVGRWF